jgi:hypothetical protein
MKKILLLIFILAGTAFTCFAQKLQSFSIGVDAGLPTGRATNIYDDAGGLSLKFESPTHISTLNISATADFSSLFLKKPVKKVQKVNYAAIEGGAKLYLHKFYLEGSLGVSANVNADVSQRIGLLYAPAVGYSIHSLDLDEIDLGIRYDGRVESGGSINMIALTVAYRFVL